MVSPSFNTQADKIGSTAFLLPCTTTSPCSLYSEKLATFDESDYDQKDAQGFINLWGLPTKVQALREQGRL